MLLINLQMFMLSANVTFLQKDHDADALFHLKAFCITCQVALDTFTFPVSLFYMLHNKGTRTAEAEKLLSTSTIQTQ